MIPLLHKIYIFCITPVRSNKIINFLLFGFYPNNKKYGSFWDWTTIELKKGIKKYYNSNMSFLDIGTGPYGVLSYYVKRRLNGDLVMGSDYSEELINNAIEQSSIKEIIYIKSDLFENINGYFDCIVFNAPYIDNNFGVKIGILKDNLSKKRWSGGEQGISTVEKFIEQLPEYLSENGICILGVNHFYVNYTTITALIKKNINLQIIKYYKNFITKSSIYIIKKNLL